MATRDPYQDRVIREDCSNVLLAEVRWTVWESDGCLMAGQAVKGPVRLRIAAKRCAGGILMSTALTGTRECTGCRTGGQWGLRLGRHKSNVHQQMNDSSKCVVIDNKFAAHA